MSEAAASEAVERTATVAGVARGWRRGVAWLPEGRPLPDTVWARRHEMIVRFAVVQSAGVGIFGVWQRFPVYLCALYSFGVALPAILAGIGWVGRRTRTVSATVSLMFASATIVDFAHGSDTAHFHFFVMVGVVALYQDRAAFGVCILITVLHHAVLGSIDPDLVYGDSEERRRPILWALVHGSFIAAASVVQLLAWKGNEDQELSDALTEMANRTSFVEQLARLLSTSATPVSVCFVDLDDFKQINDTAGHLAGDEVLVHTSRCLLEGIRPGDLVARFSGDEFALAILGDSAAAVTAVGWIQSQLGEPVVVGEREISVRASVGVADTDLVPSRTVGDLLRAADVALSLAKSRGKDRVVVYDTAVDRAVTDKAQLLLDLRGAIERSELSLFYQPIVAAADGGILGVEALVRWHHPARGLIPPSDFIPLAEESGEIRKIGTWVLNRAAAQVAEWQRDVPDCADLHVSVNVSAIQLHQGDLIEIVERALLQSALAPGYLTLEVTESTLLTNLETARSQLNDLRAMGVTVSIDDFGTGYSSLGYLSRLPAEVLKIDRLFVKDLTVKPETRGLVKAILDVARTYRMFVVAEGVETQEQWNLLRSMGCPYLQGYLFSRPVPAAELPGQASLLQPEMSSPTLAAGA